jgi:hypothetical protein
MKSSELRFKVEFGGGAKRRVEAAVGAVPRPMPIASAARQLALAYWIERRIEARDLTGLADAARALGVTRARMTQIANIRLLSMDVQEKVLSLG